MRKSDWVGRGLFVCASISAVVVFLITFYLLREGIGALNWGFLSGVTWNPSVNLYGILPTLVSTLIVVSGAVVIAVAIAIPSAIFLAEFAPFWLRNIIKSAAEVIVGIPSVVIGLFGVIVIVPFIRDNIGGRNGEGILAGWIVLALMIIPNVLTISEDALRAVPASYREASLALGATRWQTVKNVLLPSASSGIRASLILGVGRALGETMAVMMVIGNPNIPFFPTSILDQVRTLTSTIAIEFSYVSWGSQHQQALYAMGVVLFFIVMALNFVATFVLRKKVIEGRMNEVTKERYYKALLYAASGLSIIILPVIVIWVALNGAGTLSWDFLTQPPYRLVQEGIYPQIVGSIYLVALSTLFAAPLGVASAIYLSEYAPNNVITQTVRFFTETLAGVPSIVIGLFGLEFLVYELHLKTSLLAGALSLSIMMLPWTIRASEEAIKVVPKEFREASLALGATKWQTILRVVIPAALPGIITGVLLGMGRAIGETAIIWLTAGSGSEAFVPASLSAPTGSLPMYIFLVATQAATGAQHGYGAALVLIALFLSMSVSALLLRNYFLKKLNGS